jgi:hypothetical protein
MNICKNINTRLQGETNCHVTSHPAIAQLTGETFREDLWPTNEDEEAKRMLERCRRKRELEPATYKRIFQSMSLESWLDLNEETRIQLYREAENKVAADLATEEIEESHEPLPDELSADDLEVIATCYKFMDEWTQDEIRNWAMEGEINKEDIAEMKRRLEAAQQTISDKWSQDILDWTRENGIPTDAAYIKRFRALNSELDSPELSDEAFYRLAMKHQTDAGQRLRDILMTAEARAETLTRAYDDYMEACKIASSEEVLGDFDRVQWVDWWRKR